MNSHSFRFLSWWSEQVGRGPRQVEQHLRQEQLLHCRPGRTGVLLLHRASGKGDYHHEYAERSFHRANGLGVQG